jgi:hypothetical protein
MGFAPPPREKFALLTSAHTDALACMHIPYACYECTIQRRLSPCNTFWRIISTEDRCLRVSYRHVMSHALLITSGR